MNTSPEPASSSAAANPDELLARDAGIFALDGDGRVQQTNEAAARLWHAEGLALVGVSFADLFQLEVVSKDPLFHNAQWEVLAATAQAAPVPLTARLMDGRLLSVKVKISRLGAGVIAHLALVQRADLAPTPPPAAPRRPEPEAAATDAGGVFDILASHTSLGFFDVDVPAGRAHYSRTWKALVGYGAEELEPTYATWMQLLHPDDSAAAPDQVSRAPTPGERRSFSAEFRMRHRQGYWLWVQGLGVQQFAEDGVLQRVCGVLIDISERKEVEDVGLLADDRLARLSADGQLAIFDLDLVSGTIATTPAWNKLVGAETPERLSDFARALGVAEPSLLADRLRQPCAGERWFVESTRLQAAEGAGIPVLLGGQRQVSRRGDLLRVVGFALTGPAGESISSERLQGALAAASEGFIIVDETGRIAFINTKAGVLTGVAPEQARGQALADVFRLVSLAGGQPAEDAVPLALAGDGAGRLHTEHGLRAAPADAPRPIVWSVSELRVGPGQPAGLVVAFRDPVEMSLSPEELVRANRFESLGQLAGGIAHDFNNLLTTILGGISYARDNHDYTNLGDAEAACMAAATLTRQLLAFARGSRGGPRQVAKPADILRDAVRLATAGAGAHINLELDEAAGPVEVDRGQMLQVYQNLIINALQAMPPQHRGMIWLRCHDVELAEGQLSPLPAGRYVQVEVQDNGTGIPDDVIDRIFDPFFTTKQQGTGLGLSTVLSIVRKHGGELGVDSTVGVGTTFTTFLPVSRRPLEAPVRRGPSLRYGTGRILFMDDDPKIAELTARMLDSLEYTHDLAKHGEEALALYRRYLNVNRPYDVVILDMTIIGGMGGEECFQRLRELDPDVRAILTSGYDSEEMAQKYLDLGFVGYLTKPYRVSDLSKMLKSVLAR